MTPARARAAAVGCLSASEAHSSEAVDLSGPAFRERGGDAKTSCPRWLLISRMITSSIMHVIRRPAQRVLTTMVAEEYRSEGTHRASVRLN